MVSSLFPPPKKFSLRYDAKVNVYCISLPLISLRTSGRIPKSVGALITSSGEDSERRRSRGQCLCRHCRRDVRISSCPVILQWFPTSGKRYDLSFFFTSFSASRAPLFIILTRRSHRFRHYTPSTPDRRCLQDVDILCSFTKYVCNVFRICQRLPIFCTRYENTAFLAVFHLCHYQRTLTRCLYSARRAQSCDQNGTSLCGHGTWPGPLPCQSCGPCRT